MTTTAQVRAAQADEALVSRGGLSIGCNIILFLLMPGGYRTLDEIFETVTLVQTGKIRHFPIVAMGRDYWQGMLDFISETMFREGTAGAGEVGGFMVTDSVADAVEHIEQVVRGTAGAAR